ncbi:MAG: 50S ribosomal protein L13 [Candidatus Hodarchaeales archaeon]|jgi:large subunit ribosomal protein L13
MPIILNAENLILGRLATETAKILLGKVPNVTGMNSQGESVTVPTKQDDMVYIINADKAVITGNPKVTTKRYLQRMNIKTKTNPRRGPFHPRQPETIVKRAVRGMLPWPKPTGKKAYSRLRIFVGTPEIAHPQDAIRFTHITADNLHCQRISVGEVARRISTYSKRIRED